MALDPRLALVGAADPDRAGGQLLSDLGRRVTALEQARPTVQVLAGTPTTSPREGTLVADNSGSRLGVYLPALSGWRFTTVT